MALKILKLKGTRKWASYTIRQELHDCLEYICQTERLPHESIIKMLDIFQEVFRTEWKYKNRRAKEISSFGFNNNLKIMEEEFEVP